MGNKNNKRKSTNYKIKSKPANYSKIVYLLYSCRLS